MNSGQKQLNLKLNFLLMDNKVGWEEPRKLGTQVGVSQEILAVL